MRRNKVKPENKRRSEFVSEREGEEQETKNRRQRTEDKEQKTGKKEKGK